MNRCPKSPREARSKGTLRTMESLYVGVDVGTTSVRAALVTREGRMLRYATEALRIWHEEPEYYEQSSRDVWCRVCSVVKKVTADVGDKKNIRGIGFDGTCSLVVLSSSGDPVTVSPSGDPNRNIIMWLDHRAVAEADLISRTKHGVLKYVGGVLSPEMQAAKLLWLKQHLRNECWEKAGAVFDLPDYLTYRATGSPVRSMCSVVCKFNYMGHESQSLEGCIGWIDSFWRAIGLDELADSGSALIGGNTIQSPGSAVGNGLTGQAAEELDLWKGLPVGTSLIDAHAGGLGVVGADVSGTKLPCEGQPITSRMALICGTSTCHMALSQNPTFVSGVWGPYYSAMVPGFWLNEGGQSVAGKLIDHVIQTHVAYKELSELSEKSGCSDYEELNHRLAALAQKQNCRDVAFLTRNLHVVPDFHGNRSPLADSAMRGMICGLTLSSDLDSLACVYLATVQALAHGTRHIVESMNSSGHCVNTLFVCGGLCKNPLYVTTHADVTGLPCVLPREESPVLVGAAILGACASKDFSSLQAAMNEMGSAGQIVKPNAQLAPFYEKKHQVFLKLLEDQVQYRQTMST